MSPAAAYALVRMLEIYSYVVLARVLLSWVIRDPDNPLVKITRFLTDPILAPLSRVLTFGGLDLSPIAVLFGIQILQRFIASSVGL